MTKYMTPYTGNQRSQGTVGPSVSLSSSTKAIGSSDVLSRDPSSSTARPTTALPRYMRDTAVSRQRTFFHNRSTPASRHPPKSARMTMDSEIAIQAKIDGGRNILRRSVTVVEGDPATREGDLPIQGATRTDPLERITSRGDLLREADAAEGPGFEKSGAIVVEEVTVPLDLSSPLVVGQSSGVDQRPLHLGRVGGAVAGPNSPSHFIQHSESGCVRLPDIPSAANGSLRRVSSELPFIGSQYPQRENDRKPNRPEVVSRSSASSSPIDYDLDPRSLAMGDHRRVEGPPTSGGDGPLKRSMPSTTTLSSGSSFNVPTDSRHPSKVQLTDGLATSGGNTTTTTTTRQHDVVFACPMPRQSSTREDRYPPSAIDTARRSSVDRRSSMSQSRNGDIVVSPQRVSGLSEAALRILDEINLANDLSRVQNNLERFQRTSRMVQPRLSLQQAQQPMMREKKNGWADAGGRQRRPPAGGAVEVAAAGGKGLLRTSKSQPNLINHQRLQQHQQLYPHHHHHQHQQQQQQQSATRNRVNGSRNVRRAQQIKSEDLEDEVDDYDEDDERTKTIKRERIVRWLIGANECAEPPPCPTVIEEERPPQTDNAIHIVYTGE